MTKRKIPVGTSLTQKNLEILEVRAHREGVSIASIIRKAVEEFLGNEANKDG